MTSQTEKIPVLEDGPKSAKHPIVLAHGAGAPMDHRSLQTIAEALAGHGLRVIRFEFPYMRKRRMAGRRTSPDPEGVLLDTWRVVVEQLGGPDGLVIGGRSMGGRMASMVADELGVAALVCIGYPFHPPAQRSRLRTAHLKDLSTPTLILQGERDAFGHKGEVEGYDLSDTIRIHWIADGDHGLKPRKPSGRTEADNFDEAAKEIATFVETL